MSLVQETVTWLFDGANWTGANGIPRLTLAHVEVTGLSLLIASAVALPLGVGFGHRRRGGRTVTLVANVSRAIPSLALIILLASFPAFGVNTRTAVVALAVFAIPPMLINAYTGVRNVDADVVDAAKGLGMTGRQVLGRVEMPLALPLIAAGVRISTLQTFASATIASFAGTRTLGTIIQIAQATQQQQAVLGGAFVIAALALIIDFGLARLQAALSTGPARPRRSYASSSGTAAGPLASGEMIRLDSVTKRYDDGFVAVDQLDLDVADGELCMLVGPSGGGKTTTLRMINRLIEPTSGRIFLADEDVTHVDPVQLRRRMGYVIQQVGLFPHQTIADNVATVPRLLGWDRTKIRNRTNELLELVGLDPARYAKRYPSELSGGQRQRAGVAHALAADPPVLLMDEPFGAIDPITRDRLQAEFLRLQSEVHKTVVFVTHDIEEAVRMGDRIAVLADGGRLEQYDTPAQILGAPATPFVAEFVGADRGLKRLSVTSVETADLDRPPLLIDTDDLADARQAVAADGSEWAVVVDRDGRLRGWVGRGDLAGEGRVVGRTHRMEAWVPRGASLKQAFSEMLQHDAGWVAVLDDDRYVGVLTPDSLHAALRRSIDRSEGEDLEASPLRA